MHGSVVQLDENEAARFQRNNLKVRRVREPALGVDLAEAADFCCDIGSAYHMDRSHPVIV